MALFAFNVGLSEEILNAVLNPDSAYSAFSESPFNILRVSPIFDISVQLLMSGTVLAQCPLSLLLRPSRADRYNAGK